MAEYLKKLSEDPMVQSLKKNIFDRVAHNLDPKIIMENFKKTKAYKNIIFGIFLSILIAVFVVGSLIYLIITVYKLNKRSKEHEHDEEENTKGYNGSAEEICIKMRNPA